jgi:hypothetical protein
VWAAWWQEHQDGVMDRFLVKHQNQGRVGTMWEPSHEWQLAEATPSSRGFWWFTTKPFRYLLDPQSQDRRTEDGGQLHRTGLIGGSDWSDMWVSDWPVRSTGLTVVRRHILETSKRWTRVGIARLASRLSKFVVVGHPSNGAMTKISEFALERHVSLVS